MKGMRFGQHEIVRFIGHGATATVFEAKHVVLGRRAALKVMHEHLASLPELSARFVREGRVAAQIRHPHVVDVFDVGIEGGMPYLVMELLEGCDLSTWIHAREKLDIEEMMRIVLPVSSALVAAHDLGTVHRDMKPANVYLSRDRRGTLVPKLVDFGMSKQFGPEISAPLTATDAIIGTLGYMAPEQTLGSIYADARSDQYALAVIVYECVTGRIPFKKEGFVALVEAIRADPVEPPSELVAGIGPDFDAVLLRALAKDPVQRYSSVRAFATALMPFADEVTRAAWESDLDEHSAPPAPATSSEEMAARVRSVGTRSTPSGHSAETVVVPRTAPPSDAPSPSSIPDPSSRAAAAAVTLASTSVVVMPSAMSVARVAVDTDVIAPLPCAPGKSPFHIKGVAYRGLVQFVERELKGGIEALCAAIEDARIHPFLRQPFLAASRYDILPMMPINAALARLMSMPVPALARDMARGQARYDAETVYKRFVSTMTLNDVDKRLPRIATQYYDFGTCEGRTVGPGHVVVRCTGLPLYVYRWYAPMQSAYGAEILHLIGAKHVEATYRSPDPEPSRDGYDIGAFDTDMRFR